MMFQWSVKTNQFADKADDLDEHNVQERCIRNYEHLLGRRLWLHLEGTIQNMDIYKLVFQENVR